MSILGNCIAASLLTVGWLSYAQDSFTYQEVRVTALRTLMARSHDRSDVLLTSLDTILHDRSICCGKDSALGDSAERADPLSLKDVAAKLQGRHLLDDGRPIMVTADYFEPDAINSGMLVGTLRGKHALLLQWNSHVYVCYGATYDEIYDENRMVVYSIRTFLLLDTRYSDSRRELVFNRRTDDWSKVQGMMRLTVSQQ